MKVCYISDLDLTGSGYSHITINLCQGLINLGHDVKVIAMSYGNEPHPWEFSILPAQNPNEVVATYNNLLYVWGPDVTIVALDIPLQIQMLDRFAQSQVPYIAITPLESDPLCMPWAMSLMRAKKVFFISQFATDEALKAGMVNVEHLQIGVDTESWKRRTEEDYKASRKAIFGIEDDTFIVLTVADNQERKNLAGAMESLSWMKERMPEDFNWRWALVSRASLGIGWGLMDLSITLKVTDNYVEFERGLDFQKLWMLYASADVFLLTSKGEGLGMPVLEAQSVGVPVIGTDTGAIREHLSDGRGILIPHEYKMIDPYGNAFRYYIDREQTTLALMNIAEDRENTKEMIEKSWEYVKSRTWNNPILQLDEAIRSVYVPKPEEEGSEEEIASII